MDKQMLLALALIFQASRASAVDNPIADKTAFGMCASCHQAERSARAGFVPQLTSIIGRSAGSIKDYKYSSAM